MNAVTCLNLLLDVVELQTHGGYAVPKMVLKALLVAGARLAEPGEFSFRSFLNGKIDLLEAEGIAERVPQRFLWNQQ